VVSSPETHVVITDTAVQRRLLLSLGFTIFFSVLNGTMFNVSLPDIARQFSLLPSEASWVVSGYIILFAIASATYGRLADSYPVRDLVTAGILLFSAGSVIGFAARWYPLLVAGRMVQAAGSGAIPALAMLVTLRSLPPDIRGRSLGIIASVVAVAGAIGPVLGGFIATTLHWRYLFLFSLLSLAALPVLRRTLPGEARRGPSFDLSGALLLAGAVACILLSLTVVRWWLAVSGAALALWFLLHVRSVRDPFVSPLVFRDRRYRTTLLSAFLTVGSVFGMMFMTPLMLRDLNGLSSAGIGMTMLPGSAAAALLGVAGGNLSDRWGSSPVVAAGQALLALGYLLLAAAAGRSPAAVAASLVLCYAGFSLLQSSLAHAVSGILSREQLGMGMGVYNLVTFLSGAVTAALLGAAMDLARAHRPFAPLAASPGAAAYSDLFLALCAAALLAMALFSRTRRPERGGNTVH